MIIEAIGYLLAGSFAGILAGTFGVGQRTEESLPLNAQSVLYSVIYLHERLPTSSFTRNLLLPNSIGLSPLYPARPSDLQISNGSILHPSFNGLQSGQA